MQPTQVTLLEQLSDGDAAAWDKADAIYRPMIAQWLGRCGLRPEDRDDLTQDVMLTLTREITGFEHRGRLGAFRSWLRKTTVNRARQFYRRRRIRPEARGGTAFLTMMEELGDDSSVISRRFDRDHDALIVRRMLDEIGSEFQAETIRVFRLHVVEGRDAVEVAQSAGVSRWAVYQAKSRVLRRLRERIGPWAADMKLD